MSGHPRHPPGWCNSGVKEILARNPSVVLKRMISEIIYPHCVDVHVRLPLLRISLECKAYRDLGELTGCSVQFRYCLRFQLNFLLLFRKSVLKSGQTNFCFLNKFQTTTELVRAVKYNCKHLPPSDLAMSNQF